MDFLAFQKTAHWFIKILGCVSRMIYYTVLKILDVSRMIY